jgi:uncharacterized Zn-binding protein involved in type VI secretion
MHVGSTAICPHSGQVSIISNNSRVLVSGMSVATVKDTWMVTGCPFTVPSAKPQPCVKVQWLVPASRVQVDGQPVILQSSIGMCQSAEQIQQGAPNLTTTQTRVRGI